MISIYRKNTSRNFHSHVPFSTSGTKDGLSFTNGEVTSIDAEKTFSVSGGGNDIKINDEVIATSGNTIECYLHIKGHPAASTIEEVNLLNEKEVGERKKKSDDSLNIYLPLALSSEKLGEAFEVEIANNLNTNFLWLKSNEEKPFACFFDSGKIFITGYLLDAQTDDNRVRGSQEVSGISEGSALILEISATITQASFSLEKYEVRKGTRKECFIGVYEDTQELDGQFNPELADFLVQIKTVYPLGFIEDGNFIHGRKPNNISISKDNTSYQYFIDEELFDPEGTIDDGACPVPVFAQRRKFYISID